MRSNKKGIAIIATIGLLGLIAAIGISFAVNMRLELKAASNFLNFLKARLMAESAIAKSMIELRSGARGAKADAVDFSTEFDAVWTSAVWSTAENAWVFSLDNDNIDNDGDATTDEAGELDNGLAYQVLIRDEASKININDTNPNLAAILNNLAAIIGGGAIDANTGDIITGNRPAGGYRTIQEIKLYKTLGTADNQTINQAEFDLIEDSITVHSWINTKTSNPSLIAEPRAPINVNTAHTNVLQAVLRGITDGTNTMTNTEAATLATNLIANRPYQTWDDLWTRLEAEETATNINNGDAALVMANVNPNSDIMQFNPNKSWLDKHRYYSASLPAGAAMTVTSIPIDKSDLTTYTTEFCFHSGGIYEIIATGQSYNNPNSSTGARLLAEARIRTVAKLFDIVHETAQTDFRAGTLSGLDDYPEPSFAAAADWDGQLMLSTLTAPAATGTNRIQASFATSADADAGGGTLTAVNNGSPVTPSPSSVNPTPASINPTQNNPGDILNDGLFIDRSYISPAFEAGRQVRLSYAQPGNVYNRTGTMEMWVKTLWDGSTNWSGGATANRMFFSAGADRPVTAGEHTETDGGGFVALFKFQSTSPYGGPRLNLLASNYLIQINGASNILSYGRWLGNFNGDIQAGTGKGYEHWEGHEWKHIAMTWGPEVNTATININGKSRTINPPVKGLNYFLYYNGELVENWRVPVHNGHKNYTDNGGGMDDTGLDSYGDSWGWHDDKRMAGSEFTTALIDTDGDMVADAVPPGNRFSKIDDLSPPLPAGTRVWGPYPGTFNTTRNMYVGWDLDPPTGHYLDATIDEYRIHETELPAATLLSHYQAGRYDTSNSATFISQSFDLSGSRIGTISWTEHLPADITGADIEMDISLDNGGSWQALARTNPAGGVIDLAGAANIKYRAAFKESETTLLDTPVLDDVTITYLNPVEVLYWRPE